MPENRLAKEKSPYLLQHAQNPVDWYPWGDEAFQKAKKENKPVFLSIGYSTCHWCHVMERESFEHEEVAKLLNEVFVCIKVDREERPDLDGIYMRVCQMMTGSGGWPLTVFLTPERKPFFAGTYFPRESRYGRMGMFDLIANVKQVWTSKKSEVERSADQIMDMLHQSLTQKPGRHLGEEVLASTFQELSSGFDSHYGGFGMAPKFPTPHQYLFLLHHCKRTGEQKALEMVEKTLTAIRRGGIHDHVGGGIHRYSTDRYWLVPHFEKMLYDQALIALALLETYQATGDERYARDARDVFTYILRDLTSPEGGFYSAEDADSEGEEGKFYVWTEDELEQILGRVDADLVKKVYCTNAKGNWVDEATGHQPGTNILHRKRSFEELARELEVDENELRERLGRIRETLLEIRSKRVRPLLDDKILTDWNGLMIAALARGARVLGEKVYLDAARKAYGFIFENLIKDGWLLHRFCKGSADITANVDDYAFLAWGALELYDATLEIEFLRETIFLMDRAVKEFWDEADGGFFFSPKGGEELIARMKESYDGAIPAGNSVAMLIFLRLSRLTGELKFEERAYAIGKAFSSGVRRQGAAHTMLLTAVDLSIGSREVVIVGKKEADDTEALLGVLGSAFDPTRVVLLKEPGDGDLDKIAPFTAGLKQIDGKATAYVCEHFKCEKPVTDPEELRELLDQP